MATDTKKLSANTRKTWTDPSTGFIINTYQTAASGQAGKYHLRRTGLRIY